MSIRCPQTGEKVIYLTCQECEDKGTCDKKVILHAKPIRKRKNQKQTYKDHKGNEFSSFSRLCNAYGLSYNKAYDMVKLKGYTFYDAFMELLKKSGYEDLKEEP